MSAPEPLELSPIGAELLDDPAADPATVAASLRDIARANRWFGGAAAVRRGLDRALGDVPRGATVTLVDRAVARLGRRAGMADTLVGVTGDFVPARRVLNPVFLARMLI